MCGILCLFFNTQGYKKKKKYHIRVVVWRLLNKKFLEQKTKKKT